MESNYIIKNPPHALIVEAIKTLPGEPESLNLEFFADGLNFPLFPESENEEVIKEYIENCKYQNIIPFSSKRIRYEFDVEERIPKNSEAMKMFFGGGRTNRISMELYSNFDWKTIEKFKEVLFPSLLDNNYKVSYGVITISGHKVGSHENESYDPDLALRINYGSEKGLGLLLDDAYRQPKEKKSEYEKWFGELKTKYKIRD